MRQVHCHLSCCVKECTCEEMRVTRSAVGGRAGWTIRKGVAWDSSGEDLHGGDNTRLLLVLHSMRKYIVVQRARIVCHRDRGPPWKCWRVAAAMGRGGEGSKVTSAVQARGKKRVLVVGGGAAGTACAWALGRSGQFLVEVWEQCDVAGGQATSVTLGDGKYAYLACTIMLSFLVLVSVSDQGVWS